VEVVCVTVDSPWVVAHRGGRAYGPENTKRAIENGIQMDADAIEFDVRVTNDKIPILFHDKTIKRTSNNKKDINVSDLTLAELKQLDIGSWYGKSFSGEQVLTLDEAFQEINARKPLLVELKDIDVTDVTYVIDVIHQHDMVHTIYVMSFHGELLDQVKKLDARIETVFLLHKDNGKFLQILEHTNYDHIGLGRRLALSKAHFIAAIKNLEKLCFVYTVNDKRSASILLKRGVDVLITDNPIKIEQVILKQKRLQRM
jgi:glycerophosphoryl diester phosphodiesterase